MFSEQIDKLKPEEKAAAAAELAELDKNNLQCAYSVFVYTLREASGDCTNGGETAKIDRFMLYTWCMSRAETLSLSMPEQIVTVSRYCGKASVGMTATVIICLPEISRLQKNRRSWLIFPNNTEAAENSSAPKRGRTLKPVIPATFRLMYWMIFVNRDQIWRS